MLPRSAKRFDRKSDHTLVQNDPNRGCGALAMYRAGGGSRNELEHDPLATVNEFAHGIKVPCMYGRLDDHVEDDAAKRAELLAPLVPLGIWLAGSRIDRRGGDHVVGVLDLRSIEVEDVFDRLTWVDRPLGIWSLWQDVRTAPRPRRSGTSSARRPEQGA